VSWGWDKNGLRVLGVGCGNLPFPPQPNTIERGMDQVCQYSKPKSFLVAYPKP